MTLDKLKDGEKAVITKVNGAGNLRCRLLDMGLIPKTTVMIVKRAPMGDPLEIRLRGYELTIRKDEAKNIEVNKLVEAKPEVTTVQFDKERKEDLSASGNADGDKGNVVGTVKKKNAPELSNEGNVKEKASEKENKRENDADGENKKKKRRFNVFKKEHKKE